MSRQDFLDSAAGPAAGRRRILVVDGSRVVRATLVKRLQDDFGIVEENNGESAWQRLMLDGDIVAVISGVHPPRLEASDLLARMRGSALRRLRETPVVLLVSDLDNPDVDTDAWRRQGIAGFMTKSMSKEAMAECLESMLSAPLQDTQPEAQDPARDGSPAAPAGEAPAEPHESGAAAPGPLLDAAAFAAAVSALPHAVNSDESLCVLVFGIDRLDELIARFGADVADLLTGRIAKLLAAKIDPRDVLGRCGDDRVAIVSHGVDLRSGGHFGRRVCKSMAQGQIAIQGQKVRLTASVGVAATPDDRVASPAELLALADARLRQAMACGGNTVCTEVHPDCPLHDRDESVLALFRLLGGEVLEPEERNALGLAVLPLLRKVDAALALDLPLADVERRLAKARRQAVKAS